MDTPLRTGIFVRRGAVLLGLLALFFALVAAALAATFRAGEVGGSASPASEAQVEAAVQAGTSITKLPANVTPSLLSASNDGPQNNWICKEAFVKHDSNTGECVYGDPNGKRSLILFGDSHAGMWFDGVNVAAQETGWSLRIFYMAGCPAPTITFYTAGSTCNTWRSQAIAAIRKLHPTMIVVASASYEQQISQNQWATSAQWQAGLTTTLERLKSPHTQLVILGDIPLLAQSDPECLAAHESGIQACSTPRATALEGVYGDAEIAAAKATGARRIDVTPWLCSTVCPPVIDNIIVYRNRYHISRTYSLFLAGALRSALRL